MSPSSSTEKILSALLAGFACVPPAFADSGAPPLWGQTLDSPVRNAFQSAQDVSDGFYAFMQSHLPIELPTPEQDSSARFSAKLQENELRTLQAGGEPVRGMTNALTSTLLERYRWTHLGAAAEDYALDANAPGLAAAGIAGGAALYLNGLHASARAGGVRLGVDMASGMRFQGGTASRAAAVELRYKDSPLALASSWDLDHGSLCRERWELRYQLRY